ncbi:hypothetical protein XM38_030160 [Halomicronema hongdechloris C2206]|uniref:Uncharacterized protein n=1 Tax=Halomicronema hongdechloris C2206 TaxID=1641165 RepID=A0A1Z3HP67_9CYAN|nr:hypothetical protein [Halomicronema hongdechloris]ASC72062.1 hypothetical protein XM38_030160 [Halomicronema hongdechloris C2206]
MAEDPKNEKSPQTVIKADPVTVAAVITALLLVPLLIAGFLSQ